MQAFYSDTFVLPLPPGHRFPMAKYARVRQRLLAEGVLPPAALHVPPPATDADLVRCHTPDYVRRATQGHLTPAEVRRIGFPWSPDLVERSRRSVGGTIAAGRAALRDGVAVNLAGGTHHAFPDHGEGYCVFNDVAVAARVMQAERRVARVLVVDCDVHQGNGTAACAHNDPSIFTLSIHAERNFPFRKFPSDLDIGLDDGTSDDDYLAHLREGLAYTLERFAPDLAVFIAAADPFVGDRLGHLALTKPGLLRRDALVFDVLHSVRVPVAVVMGGGYAPDVDDIADVNVQTIRHAYERYIAWLGPKS